MTIKGVLINPRTGASIVEVDKDNGIEDYYKYLECDIFDITSRRIGHKNEKYFDIFCDDEGSLKENILPGAVCGDDRSILVGNLLVFDHDDEGDTVSLSDKECEYIMENVHEIPVKEDLVEEIGQPTLWVLVPIWY